MRLRVRSIAAAQVVVLALEVLQAGPDRRVLLDRVGVRGAELVVAPAEARQATRAGDLGRRCRGRPALPRPVEGGAEERQFVGLLDVFRRCDGAGRSVGPG